MRIKFWLCSSIVWIGVANAGVVVNDTGNTVSISEYTTQSKAPERRAYTVNDVIKDVNADFPLESTIDLKRVETRSLSSPMPANFALVGTGEVSQRWLNLNLARIRAANAVIIVIDAPTLKAYQKFHSVLVGAGFKVAKSNSRSYESITNGYPVLVANGEVRQ